VSGEEIGADIHYVCNAFFIINQNKMAQWKENKFSAVVDATVGVHHINFCVLGCLSNFSKLTTGANAPCSVPGRICSEQ
jgi:hypothetical protein